MLITNPYPAVFKLNSNSFKQQDLVVFPLQNGNLSSWWLFRFLLACWLGLMKVSIIRWGCLIGLALVLKCTCCSIPRSHCQELMHFTVNVRPISCRSRCIQLVAALVTSKLMYPCGSNTFTIPTATTFLGFHLSVNSINWNRSVLLWWSLDLSLYTKSSTRWTFCGEIVVSIQYCKLLL